MLDLSIDVFLAYVVMLVNWTVFPSSNINFKQSFSDYILAFREFRLDTENPKVLKGQFDKKGFILTLALGLEKTLALRLPI